MSAPRTQLIFAREARGLSRPAFARRVGLSRFHIYNVERGRRDPGGETMLRWIEALGGDATMGLWPPRDLRRMRSGIRLAKEQAEALDLAFRGA